MRKILSRFLFVCLIITTILSFTACDGKTSGGKGTTLKISIDNEVVYIQEKNKINVVAKGFEYDSSLNAWEIVGDNTVEGEFKTEGKNKTTYFIAKNPGKVKIKLNTKVGDKNISSNVLELDFKGNYISSVEQLKELKNSSDHVILSGDIDLADVEKWTPITGFKGVFNGGNYSIKNLKIDAINTDYIGLFAVNEGTIENLKIDNASVTVHGDSACAGIVAGKNTGVIQNVSVSGQINIAYQNNVGGIVGSNHYGYVCDCTNNAVVYGKDNVGGIAGYTIINRDNMIYNNINKGDVFGTGYVGGIVGKHEVLRQRKNVNYQCSNNSNEGIITGDNNVGGIFGAIYGSNNDGDIGRIENISLLKNSGEIKGSNTGRNVGGLIGYTNLVKYITDCENNANITGNDNVGGMVGYSYDNVIIRANKKANNNIITGRSYIGGFIGIGGSVYDAINNGKIVSTGAVIEDGVEIACVGGIAGHAEGLVNCVNNSDIEVTSSSKYVGGLAGRIRIPQSDVVNNNVNNGSVSGYHNVGGIAGQLLCRNIKKDIVFTSSNNKNTGVIKGHQSLGGIFGSIFGYYHDSYHGDYMQHELSLMENYGEIIGDKTGLYVGGIVGYGQDLKIITESKNNADISGNDYVGGLIGYSYTNILAANAENNNIITGRSYVGGFAGFGGVIENAVNNGTIVSTGAVIEYEKEKAYVGGIAGFCEGLINCVNNSEIKVTTGGQYVGGLAGLVKIKESNVVNNNINNGSVSGYLDVGGIAGQLYCKNIKQDIVFTSSNDKNEGEIKGHQSIGGIFGSVFGYYHDSYHGDYMQHELSLMVNNGEIIGDGTGYHVGGIVGYGDDLKLITACENHADIEGGKYVGGMIGKSSDTTIKCNGFTNINTITGSSYVGGIAGSSGTIERAINNGSIISTNYTMNGSVKDACVGGIAGYCHYVKNCENTADIVVTHGGEFVGGIAGYVRMNAYAVKLDNNVNEGKIQGCKNVGGIAGRIVRDDSSNTYYVENNINHASVIGTEDVGGLFGAIYGSKEGDLQLLYNTNEGVITGDSKVGGIVGYGKYMNTTDNIMNTNKTEGNKIG